MRRARCAKCDQALQTGQVVIPIYTWHEKWNEEVAGPGQVRYIHLACAMQFEAS